MLVLALRVLLCYLLVTVQANTEKVIFLGPSSITIPNISPGLEQLQLNALSPSRNKLETQLPVKFPTDEEPRGTQHWYLIEGLEEGRRYEVRICWVATQPTAFWLDVHTINEVFETPELISALAIYSEQRDRSVPRSPEPRQPDAAATSKSLLFLRIHSAADFFTTNQTLMNFPPDVDADIILDPFLLNVLPRSLGPTAVYLVVLAIVGWFLSGAISRWLWKINEPEKEHSS
ncbi:hypothetical protein W97_00932 [Coniosporium apollinis CBS 100218]|uniref:Uncharacterized protein n=1 Tax=Coniosporium apollinis (strain CBS 100218) TaxID=1168221 RepID=R7YJB4_CONA1|nr:uncharacterized protein W97_00932 [Coniosporium apollinis CBS 100218]EON61716.1 hypothetical protein W97_00932 [Coniosporium apollinis CBS 100218]